MSKHIGVPNKVVSKCIRSINEHYDLDKFFLPVEEDGSSLVAAVAGEGEGEGPVAALCLADCLVAAGSLVDCKQLEFHQDSNTAVLKYQAY